MGQREVLREHVFSVLSWKKKLKKARKKVTVSLTIANRREKLGFYVSRGKFYQIEMKLLTFPTNR